MKSLLTGLPLSETELQTLETDPEALAELVDEWMSLPQAEAVFTRYFQSAFQQTELDIETFFYPTGFGAVPYNAITGAPTGARTHDLGNYNFSESFARTAWYFVENDEPWTNVLTTNRYMMTPALMSYFAFRDDDIVADDGTISSRNSPEIDASMRFMTNEANQSPLLDITNPAHPDFMLFYHGDLKVQQDAGCEVPPIVEIIEGMANGGWTSDVTGRLESSQFHAFSLLWGRRWFLRGPCRAFRGGTEPFVDYTDFTDWKMVDIRAPQSGEEPTRFYDFAHFRSQNELVLKQDHVGFMTSPGFQDTWLTNEDNSSRVTINQILIVALGASFDGAAVSDFSPESLDAEHAAPGTECYGCHQTLDPMRDFVRNSLTNFYSPQEDPERRDAPAEFVFGGVQATGNGLRDLANILAEHPYFPRAWVQKLCFYANAKACEEGEEFERIVTAFTESNFNFKTLVRELFSSPMITGVSCDGGQLPGVTIARRSQFCQRLSARLGSENLCALSMVPGTDSGDQGRVNTAVSSIPDDSFSRAVVDPVTIADTSLFIRANREVACTRIAMQAFDDDYRSLPREEVLAVLVEEVMALTPSHALHAPALAALDQHIDSVVESGQSERTAFQSAFVVACMSPGSAGVGF